MPSLIEKANEVVKEQDGEVEAVPAGKDCDLSCDVDLLFVAPLATLAHFMSFLFLIFLVQMLL